MVKILSKEFFHLDFPEQTVLSLIILIGIAAFVWHPIGIPVPIQEYTQRAYNVVSGLKPGEKVLFACSLMAGQFLDGKPNYEAMMRHLAGIPGIKIVFISWGTDIGAPVNLQIFLEGAFIPLSVPAGKVYGVDWVWFDFVAGGETGVAAFSRDVWGTVKTDHYGTPVGDATKLPMMQNIKTGAVFDLIISTAGTLEIGQIAIPWREVKDMKQVGLIVPISFSMALEYYVMGLMDGFVNGQRGGAEYEILMGKPGYAVTIMDGLNWANIVALSGIAVGNIIYWRSRLQGKAAKARKGGHGI